MADSLSAGRLVVSLGFSLADNDPIMPQTWNPQSLMLALQFADAANGGGVGGVAECDKVHVSTRTLTASGGGTPSEEIDVFTTGSLLTPSKAAFGVTKLKVAVVLLQPSPAASGLVVGGAAADALDAVVGAAGDKASVPNGPLGGSWIFAALNANGVTVDNTHKKIKVANLDAVLGAKYTLILAGKA